MTATVAAHPFLAVFAAIAVLCVIGVTIYLWFTRDDGGHKAPGPWTRSAARATRAARRALAAARRLPGATRTWFHRELDGLRDYPPGAGDDPDQVIPWLHALRAAPQLHHEHPMIVPGRGTPEPPVSPPVAGGRAAGGANALPARPAGDPGPPAAGVNRLGHPQAGHPAAGDPMPAPAHPEIWTRYDPDPDPWHTQRIPPVEVPAAKDAAALDYMPRAPFVLWNSDTFVSGLPAIRDGA